ncbi:MAG: bifunctional glutamate N-acetyltransferase/amino-acid acetyltransferase ArgJ, partial [Sedimentisphaerales bacterium]|nr:bifunctional glutamate N-acetyltransferase/amino-acid acetyltransferase ArgJ [Sedimentisphaerales bacterium]
NQVVAPAVVINRDKIRSGRAQAVFVNAGNANTCTGRRGERDVHAICRAVAGRLGLDAGMVLVCSTGIIGRYLPMAKVRAGIRQAADRLSRSAGAYRDLAGAILTTDTRRKTAGQTVRLAGGPVWITGIAKGSGMIAPHMATMLAFLTTDANISAPMLRRALTEQVERTFNKVSVDNHMSTSDTVICLASGRGRHRRIDRAGRAYQSFAGALGRVCDDLARQIAADGEGATCMVTVRVRGAASTSQARAAVRAIVDSPLVRCAFHGADPNWGRIVSAVGYSGARLDADRLRCTIAGVCVFRAGRPCRFDAAGLQRKMRAAQWTVEVDLAVGRREDFCYTCDLSRGYIRINADYHT